MQGCAWAINFDYPFFATLIRQQWANGDALVRDHLLYNPDIKKGLKVSKSAHTFYKVTVVALKTKSQSRQQCNTKTATSLFP